MTTQMKQRIIGGLVLVAILAIFLPIVFHHSRPSQQLKLSLKMPKSPQAPQMIMQLPQQPGHAQTQQQASTTTTGNSKSVVPQSSSANESLQQPQAKSQPQVKPLPMTPRMVKTMDQPKPVVPTKTLQQPNKVATKPAAKKTIAPKKKRVKRVATRAKPVKKKPRAKKQVVAKKQRRHSKKSAVGGSLRVPKAWSVQLASFGNRHNAARLVKRLRSQGFDVYTRRRTGSDGKLYTKVFVGPELLRDRAIKLQQQLKAKFRLNGVIRRYKI